MTEKIDVNKWRENIEKQAAHELAALEIEYKRRKMEIEERKESAMAETYDYVLENYYTKVIVKP